MGKIQFFFTILTFMQVPGVITAPSEATASSGLKNKVSPISLDTVNAKITSPPLQDTIPPSIPPAPQRIQAIIICIPPCTLR